MSNIKLICVATDRNDWLNDWEQSVKKWKYNYKILGLGVKWEGFKTLMKLLIDFLENCDRDELICKTDSYDLIMIGPPKELFKKYKSKNKKIVVSSENVCGPNCIPTKMIIKNKFKPHLNAGCIIGKAGDLLKMYKESIELCSYDDQVGITKYVQKNKDLFYYDSEQSITLNLNYSNEISKIKLLKNGRFLYKPTNEIPVIMHTPFIQKDFGARCNFTRSHALKNYKKKSFFYFLGQYIKHIQKHMFNPIYRGLLIKIIIILIIITIIIIYFIYKK